MPNSDKVNTATVGKELYSSKYLQENYKGNNA